MGVVSLNTPVSQKEHEFAETIMSVKLGEYSSHYNHAVVEEEDNMESDDIIWRRSRCKWRGKLLAWHFQSFRELLSVRLPTSAVPLSHHLPRNLVGSVRNVTNPSSLRVPFVDSSFCRLPTDLQKRARLSVGAYMNVDKDMAS